MESVTMGNKKRVLPSLFSKIKFENRFFKNTYARFVTHLEKMSVIFDFSRSFARLTIYTSTCYTYNLH